MLSHDNLVLYMFVATPMLAWITAQGAKHIFVRYNRRAKIIDQSKRTQLWMASGGMPSAHSATVVALSEVVGLTQGFTSPLFAVCSWFSLVVIYDAMMVRYSSGKQGDALIALLKEQKSKVAVPKIAHGHTPLEVAAGAAIGVVVGLVVFFATK